MPNARKVTILHPDGDMMVYDCPITESGPDATTLIDVEGVAYHLYRFTAVVGETIEAGYVAAPTPPTEEERARLSCALFGPHVLGIRSLERVSSDPEAAGVPENRVSPPRMRDAAPSGIVIRFAFRDGVVEDVFGECGMGRSLLADYPDAICAYRFLRPSTNQFLPWIPVTLRELGNLRSAITHRLEILTGGTAIDANTTIARAANR